MKKLLFLITLATFTAAAHAQDTKPSYDAELAKKLGADERGMKMYVMGVLKTGPATITDPQKRDTLFRGHMANIKKLVKEGKLIIAGPFEKNDKQYRGLFIFDVPTIEEAQKLVAADPTVAAGIFVLEYYLWYGSAAIPTYLEAHEKIDKTSH